MKSEPIPLKKEEMDKILELASENEFDYLLFMLAKTTGRRLGEFVGTPEIEFIPTGKFIKNKKGEEREIIKRKPTGKYIGGILYRDIDWDRKMIKMKVLKGRKEISKDVMLTDEVIRLLRLYCNRRQIKVDEYIFKEKGYRGIQETIKRYGKKAGIPHPVFFHHFRHFFITELQKKGMTLDKIKVLTGHKSLASMEKYSHIMPEDIRNEALPLVERI